MLACTHTLLWLSRPAGAQESQSFRDSNQSWRNFDREYAAWFLNREPHYLRAGAEMLVLIGLGTAYYWSDPLANEVDWDDPSMGSKFSGSSVRFDTNLTSTNAILHPAAGGAFYGFSRVNGLSPYAAFGYAAASAVAWEYALEWREQVSVNDMIFTPIGGIALGEFLFRLGDYAGSAASNSGWGNQLARYTIGLPQTIHAAIDGVPDRRTGIPPDRLGASSAYWHRFTLGYGVAALHDDLDRSGLAHALSAGAELTALPGFLRPGKYGLFFDEGNFTAAGLRILLDGAGLVEVDAKVSATLLGLYSQRFGAGSGRARLLGLKSALRYFDSWRLDRRDGFAFAHFPGPVLGVWQRWNDLELEAEAEAHVDFAALRPLAYPAWRAKFGSDGVKTVLLKQGYAYDWCGSTQGQFRIAHQGFKLGGDANLARCRSIQGLDRFQSAVTRDIAMTDDVVELRAYAAIEPPAPLELRVQYEQLRRRGSMASVETRRQQEYVGIALDYVF
jgi:hypothetical protein